MGEYSITGIYQETGGPDDVAEKGPCRLGR